ncbi:MAG: protein kinase [Proteobacteria bacterium]|nr:protein kinase [Pseudomonadota bacterium]
MQDRMVAVREVGIPFGRYLLLRRLARGGMAEVFLARQSGPGGFERLVAVKRILPHLVDTPDFVQMFLDEARLAARLTHPNVAHIYEFGQVDEHYFIAMEYVDGVHAGILVERGAYEKLPAALVARIGADACDGLNYAHNVEGPDGRPLHLVHRDVSPPNLLISQDGVVKLVDFGIAKAVSTVEKTQPGIVKGKFAYMSPEQTMGLKLDGRSDVFSLGLVLWELLAGRVALGRTDPVAAMTAIRDGKLPSIRKARPDVSPQLASTIERALHTDPNYRLSAAELGNALEGFIKSSPELGTSMQLAQWIRQRYPRTLEPTGPAVTAPAHVEVSPSSRVTVLDDSDSQGQSPSGRFGPPPTMPGEESARHAESSAAKREPVQEPSPAPVQRAESSKGERSGRAAVQTAERSGRASRREPDELLDSQDDRPTTALPAAQITAETTTIESSSAFMPDVDEEAPTEVVLAPGSGPSTTRGDTGAPTLSRDPAGSAPARVPARAPSASADSSAPARLAAASSVATPASRNPAFPGQASVPRAEVSLTHAPTVALAPSRPAAGRYPHHPTPAMSMQPAPPPAHFADNAPYESDRRLWIAAITAFVLAALIALALLLDDEPATGAGSDAGVSVPGASSSPPAPRAPR